MKSFSVASDSSVSLILSVFDPQFHTVSTVSLVKAELLLLVLSNHHSFTVVEPREMRSVGSEQRNRLIQIRT